MPPAPFRRILVTDRLREDIAAELRRAYPALKVRAVERAALTAADLDNADVYAGFGPPPGGYGNVRWIHSLGAGVDAFLDPPPPPGILLTRSLEDFGTALGEYCLARALAWTQGILPYAADQAARRWHPREAGRLSGRVVLVIGTGRIGQAIARGFHRLGAHVRGLSRRGRIVAPFLEVGTPDSLAGELRRAEIVILAAPLTPASRRLLDATLLASCQGAFLINVGRGGLLDEDALSAALDAGHLSGAALDVFAVEPLPSSSPLWSRKDVMISPHVGGLSTARGAADSLLQALEALEAGREPPGLVDTATGY